MVKKNKELKGATPRRFAPGFSEAGKPGSLKCPTIDLMEKMAISGRVFP
jgi:hypothetical protein